MKIGLDARLYDDKASGIGTYIKNLSDWLFEIDQENEYLIFFQNKNDWENFSCKKNVKKKLVSSLPFSYKEQSIFLFNLLKENLDLVHFPHFNFPIFYPKKFVSTIHDTTSLFYPGEKRRSSKIHQLAFEMTFKTALKRSEKIITGSNFAKNNLIKHFPSLNPDKIKVIYEGIKKGLSPIKDEEGLRKIKEKYSIDKPFILFIGAWRKHKNLERLALAFDILKEKYSLDYQLVIAGQEDSFSQEIKKRVLSIKSKKDLILPGFVPKEDQILLYQEADLFVLPSLSEGFGLIGLEAMACGTPVISSKTSCLPEIYQQAAEYFDPYNIEEMAEKIAKVLTDKNLKKNLIKKGFQQIKNFSWKNCSQETLKIYQESFD